MKFRFDGRNTLARGLYPVVAALDRALDRFGGGWVTTG
jgi:hypothetical protein